MLHKQVNSLCSNQQQDQTGAQAGKSLLVLHVQVHRSCSQKRRAPVGALCVRPRGAAGCAARDPPGRAGVRAMWSAGCHGTPHPVALVHEVHITPEYGVHTHHAARRYTRCSQSAHVERDLMELQAQVDAFEQQR